MFMVRKIFTDRLSRASVSADVSQSFIAKELKTSRNTVNRWFNGHSFPEPETIDQLAEILGVTPQWLFGANDHGLDVEQVKATRQIMEFRSSEILREINERLMFLLSEEEEAFMVRPAEGEGTLDALLSRFMVDKYVDLIFDNLGHSKASDLISLMCGIKSEANIEQALKTLEILRNSESKGHSESAKAK